ncbi:MAG: hypothetical protein PF637_03800 [Spirochaetes bacterium]|jgi:hypothetical protein|nr:hypothetical protein [Spirochaetota bacterium]
MSHYNYSKRALFFSNDKRVELQLRKALQAIDVDLVKDIPNLSSLATIKTVIKSVKGAGFMRAELFNFIQKHGYPYLVIMDLRLDLGLDNRDDPGKLKLLKTFLISYIIFSMGRGFDKLHLNLVLVYSSDDEATVEGLSEDPSRLLSLLHTKNEEVNALISRMKSTPELFNKIFSISFVPRQGIETSLEDTIVALKSTIAARNNLTDERVKKSLGAVENSEKSAAEVYFVNGKHWFANGHVCETPPERYAQAESGNLFIEGYWTAHTAKEVSQRIVRSVSAAAKEPDTSDNQQLTIHLQEKCIIDGTIASILAGLILQHLSRNFSHVSVRVSRYNEPILKKSQGFSMIKEYLVYEE